MQAFEGPEKKLEINVIEGYPSLRQWPVSEWEAVVEKSQAKILSKVSSDSCDAYLLSESSLIVWDDCVVMITCGTTVLVSAAEHLLKKIGNDNIESFFFERKNEYFPFAQKSDFRSDVLKLKEIIDGNSYQFGRLDEHHLHLFSNMQKSVPKRLDTTLEILMYDMSGKARYCFQTPNLSTQQIRQQTGVDRILAGFDIDDYSFDPIGYSLNAVKGSRYYTIHVTPQQDSPYVSFETNEVSNMDVRGVIQSVLETFQPRSFDIMFFDPKANKEIIDIEGYDKRSSIHTELSPGFSTQFGHFSKKSYESTKPTILNF